MALFQAVAGRLLSFAWVCGSLARMARNRAPEDCDVWVRAKGWRRMLVGLLAKRHTALRGRGQVRGVDARNARGVVVPALRAL